MLTERSRITLLSLLAVLLTCTTLAQNPPRFRSGIFFHLSTGRNIWGQPGATTSVPAEIHNYNVVHGLTGPDSVSLRDTIWWPQPDNMWSTWHQVFLDNFPPYDLRPFYTTEKIIMIKACFPSSNMSPGGIAWDTLNPTLQDVYNFKCHWRSIIRIMRQHPLNFFVIWTNAPQVASQTSDAEATAAEAACRWAKDTLAAGLDPICRGFPANVYVFDLFHQLALANGKLDSTYQTSSSDAHPNAAATNLVAPQLVKEVFDASIAYENNTPTSASVTSVPQAFSLSQNYPNPFNPATTIRFGIREAGFVSLKVYDVLGREVTTLVSESKQQGAYTVTWNAERAAGGMYFCKMHAGNYSEIKMLLLR